MTFTSRTLAPLTDDQLMRAAPSIFAAEPWHAMSDRYRFVPTIDVIGFMRRAGFLPVRADQSRSRIEGKESFTRHLIRFRHSEHFPDPARPMAVGTEIPEIVLVNSHDGTSGYQLDSGIFRLVCSNGMIVQSANFGSIKVRHSGRESDFYEQISDATSQLVQAAPRALETVQDWRRLTLDRPAQLALASAAIQVRDDGPKAPTIPQSEPLRARRREDLPAGDGTRDLWTTVNVVQENVIRGGMRGAGSTGKRYTSRAVGSVSEDVRLNRAIWSLGEKMAEIMRGAGS